MKASELADTLGWMIEAGNPTHTSGAPGVGKTSVHYQVAKTLGMEMLESRLALCESIDLRGLPTTDMKTGVTRWLTPAEFPREGCKPTMWFFDEWMQGLPSVQAAAGQLLNARRIGDYKLPDNVYLCGASNCAKDRAATNRMPAQVADRFCMLELDVDVGDWCKWAAGPGGVALETIAFIRWRDELLSAFNPNADVSPTCRSWGDGISRATIAARGKHLPAAVEMQGYAGIVGKGAAAEYMGFLSVYRGLPDPQAMLMAPDTCSIPDKPDVLCALSAVLAKRATKANMDRVIKIAARMPEEFAVLLVTNALLVSPDLSNTKPFIAWAEKNHHVLN